MGKSQSKAVIYINCGMHAREWISISSCLWMINELVTSKTGSVTSLLLDTYDFWFVPVANPDGYIYSWTTDRLWRKNRSPGNPCSGVDLNRNFDVGFNATSRNPCSISYGGVEPESEEETKALTKLLYLNSYRIKATLFIHSFSQLWLSPYSVNNTYPKEYPEMVLMALRAVNAVKSFFGTDFNFGSIANVLYSAPGSAVDYCYETFGIVNSFVVQLRDRGTNGFMLPLDEIKPTAIETWAGLIAMALAINEKIPQTNTDSRA
ncbi:hypothetical protein DAPPUDRAFT_50545 [Daphnia pulex]|uniref:Peptidase M14 domain-containing protein n=1 Tax=Daphnia pulex TaxID=6669 RepID=E9GI16_DAPPU|nr:hypothetical protein DAPPUDRAFT_50545 [Daphnia pulex]|eukprot:EFX80934.1 hypothetical protein DAPPUDRAFT_50545 [Daphnia pulex]